MKENFDRFTHDNFKEKEMADFRKMLFVLAGLLMATGTGVFFGVYPARKAAQLDPIVALRAE